MMKGGEYRMVKSYIVTIKNPHDPKHNPRNKKTGICGFAEICTDVTGAHHSFIVFANSIDQVKAIVKKTYGNIHITRIELPVMLGNPVGLKDG